MRILIIFSLFIFSSCGADKLSSQGSVVSSSSSQVSSSSTSCLCTSDYVPVCGVQDKKSYENACLAKCFGNQTWTSGNCICKNEVMVCGTDGQTYTECEAKANKVEIVKYSPCENNPN